VELLFAFYAFALGAIIGSFLNVVIHRYPLGESIVSPPSRCPRCRRTIRFYDNIPIVSWLLLRGRCRACGEPIAARYVTIELANALFYLAIFLHTGVSVAFLFLAAIVSMLIVLIYIDLDIQILPDVIDLPGIVVGLAMAALGVGASAPGLVLAPTLLDSALGAAAGAGGLLLLREVYRLVRGIEGMGLGDVKMLAMLGAVVGWMPLLPLIFIASLAGALVGIAVAIGSREGLQAAIPFGVFLGLAAFTVIFFGHTLLEWYRALLPA
jgi:leader peptidase (prepilin peptidase) / N-methyltransferase